MAHVTEMRQTGSHLHNDRDAIPALSIDESRQAMLRRVKRMTVEERLDLFDQLSRDAAWAQSAKRVR